ncbi:MAG TPA: strawberry notch family protein [Alphaproteobacteria bacterium]
MPPAPTYQPRIPKALIAQGALSLAQLEAVVYAGQAHEKMLPAGEGETPRRRGFFIGDGTGVGKGREVAGIILDNWNQGRTKAIWISEKKTLLNDAKRDWSGLGQDPRLIFDIGKVKAGERITAARGILFSTYDTLKGGLTDQKSAVTGKFVKGQRVRFNLPETGEREGVIAATNPVGPRRDPRYRVRVGDETIEVPVDALTALDETPKIATRVQQIVDWVGSDFDGVIAFDESHNMANAVATKGARGMKDAAEKALAGLELQRLLPNARVVYVSATGATEVSNLAYAERLGLWGRGTPFATMEDFITKVSQGGIAAMELIARDMKALGLYIARNLSYDGVEYDRIEHRLTDAQREIYDALAEAWQVVLRNIHRALEITGGGQNPRAKSAAMSAFWGAHQRFFNQIITSMQMPSVLKAIEQDLKEGRQAVLQIVNTNEASQERAAAKIQSAEDLEDLDITPRDQIIQLVEHSFPTQQFEEYVDEGGNVRSRPVVDSEGNPVENKEAVALRDELIDRLASIRVPQGPLEMLLDHFGVDQVAEVTGRKRRFVLKPDPATGEMRRVEEMRPASANVSEADLFQAGKKKILIFSDAGGTGRSYHADNTAPSKNARRAHYLVQAGWRADKAIQGFGRTHRTNQASAPIFRLVTTDLKGQKRFISSIARRLAQLGALTKGQRQAADQGVFSARDNLESTEARDALRQFYHALARGGIPGVSVAEFQEQTGLSLFDKDGGGLRQQLPPIEQFLNRLLSLKIDMQAKVFDAFEEILNDIIEAKRQAGTLDIGLETIRADKVEKVSERTVYTDPESGAETKYVRIKLSDRLKATPFDKLLSGRGEPEFFAKSPRGKFYAVYKAPSRTAEDGSVIDQYRLVEPSGSHLIERERIDGPKAQGWQKITGRDEAAKLWQQEIERLPPFIVQDLHLITGAVLPIWDRLGGHPRVVRLQTDAGERFLGRAVPSSEIAGTLKALGAEADAPQIDPAEAVQRILDDGQTAVLSNGWTIQRRMVAGEPRIEIRGPQTFGEGRELQRDGVFIERIEFRNRYFIPTGENAARVLAAVTKYRPIVEMRSSGGPRLGALGADGGIRLSPARQTHRAKIIAAIIDEMRKIAPYANLELVESARDIALQFPESMHRTGIDASGADRVFGYYMNGTVSLAMSVLEQYPPRVARAAVRHEAGIHFLKDTGFILPQEWALLERAARENGWLEEYGVPDVEEAVAYKIMFWRPETNREAGAVARILKKIREFFVRLGNALRGMGFQTWQDVFERILSGEVGARMPAVRLDALRPKLGFLTREAAEEVARREEEATGLAWLVSKYRTVDGKTRWRVTTYMVPITATGRQLTERQRRYLEAIGVLSPSQSMAAAAEFNIGNRKPFQPSEQRAPKDVRRGAQAIIERLQLQVAADRAFNQRAAKAGKETRAPLTHDDVREIDDFIRFVGEEMFGDVGLSIRADKGPQGQFNYASAIVAIYRKAIQQGLFSRTTVHELWHALERALPAKDRDAVIKAWERAVARYARANPWYAAFRNTRHLTGRAAEQFRKDHPEALQRDDIVDLGDEGVMLMNTEENYRLVNADEFFAETMADRYFDRRRQEARELRSLWAHAVGVVRRMVAGFMRRFGYDPMGRIFETYASRGYAPPRPLSESITGEAVSFAKKDYDRLKYRLAEAAKRAAEQVAGREQVPENVRVEQPKVNRGLNALKVPFWVPSSLFKDWAPLQRYVLRASKRTQAMSAALTRLRERWDNIVKPLSQEQFGELTAILFEGDIEQTVYTPEELATRGASEPVIEAYGKARRFFDLLGRLVDQHERAMRPTLRRAKLSMLGKLRKASPLSAEELDGLLNHRTLLRARLRAAEDVDAAKALMAELAEIDARLGFDADPNTEDEFSKLLQGIDRIDDQLARTSVRRIKGYVPHKFFGSWALYELVEVEEEGEKRTERRLVPAPATGFLPSRTAALEWARKVAADRGPEARFVVAPVRVGLATESSLTLPRPRYEELLTRLQDAFGLTPEEVRENVREAGIKPRSGRRTASFKQRRNWVEGHSRDLARVIDTHIGEVVRYVHLDTLKYEAMILEDRLGLQPDRREVRTLTDAFQAYVRDVLGEKQPLEARIDELFERPWAQPLQVGLASGIGTFLLAGGISSNPFVPLLLGSLVGYRMYVARRKSGEIGAFHSRGLTGEALNVVSHLKLGAFFNLFSAVVNLTQVPLNTLSVLPASAVANGIRRYMTAVASGVRGKPNHDLRLLQRHNVDPVYKFSEVSPHLYDRPGMIERASMFVFDNVEKFNRAVTFLAAYYHALSLDPEAAGRAVDAWAKRENADPARFRSVQLGPDGKFTTGGAQRFAAHTMTRTQFDMSAAMRPALLRNVFARVPLQFKNFMIQQTAFVVGLDRKEELPRFLLSMFLVAGVLGLPGIQLLDGLLDWLFGISPIEEVKRAALKAAAYGDLAGDIAYAIARGLPAFIGWDISSRTGMGESFLPKFTINDLIGPGPGTILKARELAERNASLADQLRNLAPGLGAPLKSLEAAANGLPVETMLTDPASFFAALGDERAVLTSPWKRGAPELPDRALSSGQLALMAVGGTPAELTRLRDFTAVTEAAREDYRQELQRAHDRIGQAYTRYFHTDPGRFLREVAEVQEQFSRKTGYTLTRESIRAVIRNQALARDQRSLRSLPRQLRPEAMELQRGIMGVE